MTKLYGSLDSYERKFAKSAGVVASAYCADSGFLPAKACHADLRGGRIETGYFKRGTEPKSHCVTHVLVRYDKVTHAIACEKCPEENVTYAGLLKVERSFPCDVKITDSQYTYMYLPAGVSPALDENLPYFARMQKSGVYYGTSGVAKAKNRYCREHFLETTAETEPPPSETAAPPEVTGTTPEATAKTTSPASASTAQTASGTTAATVPAETTSGTAKKAG
jgi:hypothetical protein